MMRAAIATVQLVIRDALCVQAGAPDRVGSEVPADALEATVAAYNAACPDESGFDHLVPDGLATSGVVPMAN